MPKRCQLFCPKLMISVGHTYEGGFPTPFYNLKWLKLDLPYGDRYTCHYREPYNINNLLERFPNLETLVIDICDPMSFNRYIEDWKTETLQFSMHHLKSVAVRAFSGRSNEVGLLKFLLDGAVVLEKAVIATTSVRSLTDHEKLLLKKIIEEIKSNPQASSYAEILFK
ncbi:hypothetical protein GIB67_032076 [Kingdonia uniflora]|uniref:FBD domain-containing protein n=1 Tax=Kingdonia uniflora TaxID=39325 RepID=A0A7J7MWL4_9MAGN|nr:hypothetical protein GIB67_032076 [Kingdonia uniflora]